MKKIDTKKQKIREKTASRKIQKQRNSRGQNKSNRNGVSTSITTSLSKVKLIRAPENLSIYEVVGQHSDGRNSYVGTLKFAKNSAATLGHREARLFFRKTRRVTAAGALICYAGIEKSKKNGSIRPRVTKSRSDKVNLFLSETGIFSVIEKTSAAREEIDLDESKIVSSSANTFEVIFHSLMDYIKENVFSPTLTDQQEAYFSDAISETINNVVRHAYPENVNDEKSWWVIVQAGDSEVHLAIYDEGVGIPITVVERHWFENTLMLTFPEKYQEIIGQVKEISALNGRSSLSDVITDAELIYLSMQGDVSSIPNRKHGQGSKSIRTLVEQTKDGNLWIFSNSGLVVYEEGEVKPTLHELPRKFPGTLVQWNMSLGS